MTRTDKIQFVLMFLGFSILLITLVARYGGITFLDANLPPHHLNWHGGNSTGFIFAWFFIALWTFVDPGFHQRCYAAKSPRVARQGILVSVGFWFIFDFMTTACGLYARALLPDIDPVLSFPLLGHQYLPAFLSGLFLTALLATIMSTIDSLSLLSAVTLGYDLFGKTNWRRFGSLTLMRIGLLATAALSILLALLVPSVVQIWYVIGTLFVPALLLPLLACYFPAIMPSNKKWMVLMMLMVFAVSLLFISLSVLKSDSLLDIQYLWGWQPIYPGLFTSLLLLVFAHLIGPGGNPIL